MKLDGMRTGDQGCRDGEAGHVLVTGGAGFVGVNLCRELAARGERVVVLDDLSRHGVDENLAWLLDHVGDHVSFVRADVRDYEAVANCVEDATAVFHLAAQVAVTTSLLDPITDFQVNAAGTLNVLEAIRRRDAAPPFCSTRPRTRSSAPSTTSSSRRRRPATGRRTGPARDRHRCRARDRLPQPVRLLEGRRRPVRPRLRPHLRRSGHGLPHELHLRAAPARQPDQGWVAHFARAAVLDDAVTFYGDGKQVRDILFVDDLVDAMLLAREHAAVVAGRAFTIGGGPGNTVSLIELVERLEELTGRALEVRTEGWRAADQRYYVSDVRGYHEATGWSPRTGFPEGLRRLLDWVRVTTPVQSADAVAAAHGR